MNKEKSTTVKKVTKSIRLTADEAHALGQLVEDTPYAEAGLMRQWVLAGMDKFRVTEAIRAYQEDHLPLREAAKKAGLPVAVFIEEMADRKVAILDQSSTFGPGLEAMRDAFGRSSDK